MEHKVITQVTVKVVMHTDTRIESRPRLRREETHAGQGLGGYIANMKTSKKQTNKVRTTKTIKKRSLCGRKRRPLLFHY